MLDAAEKRSFGKELVIARLGRGGMGDVFLAVHLGAAGVNKIIVIKELRHELAGNDEARTMFLDEARLATRFNHPNLVQTFDVVDQGDSMYLTMEFLDGQPLSAMLTRDNRLGFSTPMLLSILASTLDGLQYAHELTDYDGTPLGIVHRDVSPQNIVVTYEGQVKLVDFGVAKVADQSSVTASGVFKGKVKYSAPEQATCQPVDRRADIFGMGTVLWEIIVGQRMWKDMGDMAVLFEIAAGRIPSARAIRPDIPPELDAIASKALAPSPNDRFATAKDFADALRGYLGRLPLRIESQDISDAITQTFARQKRELHALIDSQVRTLQETSHGRLRVREIPLILGETSSQGSGSARTSRTSLGSEAPSVSDPAATKKSGGPLVMLAMVAAGVLLVGAPVGLLAMRHAGARTTEAASPAPGLTVAPQAERVMVKVRAQPAQAALFLDGIALPSNPYEAYVARGAGDHTLTARAEGFEPRNMDVSFQRDISIDLTLAPSPAVVAAQPTTPKVESPPAAPRGRSTYRKPAQATPKPARPQGGGIDEESPY